MTALDRALATLRDHPGRLPKEPHAARLLPATVWSRARLGKVRREEVCRGCGRIFVRAHVKRVNCDLCCRVRKVVRT